MIYVLLIIIIFILIENNINIKRTVENQGTIIKNQVEMNSNIDKGN
jgi:hypothetical protein